MTVLPATRLRGNDDVNISLLEPNAQVVFYYGDGTYVETQASIRKQCPHAELVPIAVRASFIVPKAKRLYLDDEPGDADNSELVGWYHMAKVAGVEIPGDYTSVANVMAVIRIMEAAGLKYGIEFLIWSAHYTGIPHLCGPQCGFGLDRTVHNTQWTDRLDGRSLDGDLCTALGVGIDTTPVDPNHYPRYDQRPRDFLQGRTEQHVAMAYDAQRAKITHHEPNGGSLHLLRDECSQCSARIEHEIVSDLIHGKQDPSLFWRGWRKSMLDRRAAGQKVTV